MKHRFVSRTGLAALAAAALFTLSPAEGHAEQFVLFDETFEYTWEDAINATPSKSHYYIKESSGLNLDRPDNWLSPVDYRNGKVHIHVEVLEKPPGDQETGWALCYVGNAGSYGCPYTEYYTGTGTYVKEVSMTDFYNDHTIDWSQGIRQVDLIYTINDSGSGHVHNFENLKDQTTPTKVRIAMVQLSAGATFDPAGLPGSGAGGAGGMGGGGGGAGSGGAGAAGTSGGAGASTGGAASGGVPGGSGGGGQPAVSGGIGGGGNVLPTAGASSTAGSAGAPATNPAVGGSADDGSCAVAFGGARGQRGAWLMLALVALWRKRRARV